MFLSLIGFALILPGLLEMLPPWLIPNRLSDFSYWGALAGRMGDDLMEYLRLKPMMRDVTYMILFYKQAFLTFMSVIFVLLICISRDAEIAANEHPDRISSRTDPVPLDSHKIHMVSCQSRPGRQGVAGRIVY